MSHPSPNKKVDQEPKKDDRLIILLGIGVFLLCIFYFSHFSILPASSRQQLSLQWNGTTIVVDTAGTSLMEAPEDSVREMLMPATLTPFFFAPLPINEADQLLLETLPGIGPHLASEIIKTRSQRGPFHGPEDLLYIQGIGKKRMLKFAHEFSYR
jgi:hypothetical protein